MLGNPPLSKYVECAGWEIHYLEWGEPHFPAVLAWHGLARVGRDFDALARELSGKYRVIAPDTIGRGFSQWSENGDKDYCFDVYGKIAQVLCDQLGIEKFGWIGTSMGGSLGMFVASDLLKDRITHLVINDIGPELPQEAIDRIVTYVGKPIEFNSMNELERYLRVIYAPFGYIPGDEWRAIAEASARRMPNGSLTTHYDPEIVRQFIVHPDDWFIWDRYDSISAKTLLLRGEYSDLLTEETAMEMLKRGPRPTLLECKGCGHAPALNVPFQTEKITDFLAS
jgi:pimeloyl-ACP methyl ester carboxylesterase